MTNTTQTPISTHAAKAVTQLVAECHLMEFCDADAERIVQDAIDKAMAEAEAAKPRDYAEVIE